MGTLATLKDLATKAGRWLGLATKPALHTQAIDFDKFDEMEWRHVEESAAALRELTDDLSAQHDYATDLVRDVWTGAYKSNPQVRPREQMDPSRAVNHQVISTLLATPEWGELRRETVGDAYAAAMAVLAQSAPLRRMLEQTREAQQAAQELAELRQQQAAAAQQIAASLAAAEAAAQQNPDSDEPGAVPAPEADDVEQAIAAAAALDDAVDQADAAARATLAKAGPAVRSAMRQAARQAAEQAREESALMAAWGVEPGQLQRMDFETRRQLAEKLRGSCLGNFADLIGRFRQMARGERAHKTEHATGELVGITLGDDLGKLIPSELASLGVPALRAVFAARLAEGRLMTYQTRGEEHTGKGAIIALIDTSYSMTNKHDGITREAWAKAAALALLDQARQARRPFAGILFSDEDIEPKVFEFPGDRPPALAQVLEFAETFLGGGTDFATPLDVAAELLQHQYNAAGAQRGDIVIITDGESGITEEWMRSWLERKARLDFRVFGIAVAHEPGDVLDALTDNLRTVTDLTDVDGTRDIFRAI
ncbi:VWA domain-containing protein [Nonomuraea sp. NPDC050536]|uniref:VWA domain-containing protein n=1 Tax=Nonomuraea sp. NPDC050536 TaxID=3364366 RepID=UPI0037CA0B89